MMRWLKSRLAGKPTLPGGGGLALPRNKPGLPQGLPPGLPCAGQLDTLPWPETLILPLINYRREPLEPWVEPGQSVRVGELLAEGLPSSASGIVTTIEPRTIIHPSALQAPCVVIACDTPEPSTDPVHPALPVLTLQRLRSCGVVGLGGAAFSTAEKFSAQNTLQPQIDTLIINAVECEPLVSCDEALMMVEAADITQAIDAMMDFSACSRCLIAIEEDKYDALAAMRTALQQSRYAQHIELVTLAAIYPSGAERVLVQRLTGQAIPANGHPSDLGMVCINVATALAAWRAQCGHPLVSRLITVAGSLADNPVNVRVHFGTRVADVLRQTGNDRHLATARVRVGGPLSGFDLHDIHAPISASTNSILVESGTATTKAQPCIGCSACSDACPVGLLPQQLYRFAREADSTASVRLGLDDCITCGCCDLVCPSRIALTSSFRFAKGALREQQTQTRLAAEAKQRHEQHLARMQQRQAAREQKRQAARERLAAAALQEANTTTPAITQRVEQDKPAEAADPIAAALLRARQRRGKKSAGRGSRADSSSDSSEPAGGCTAAAQTTSNEPSASDKRTDDKPNDPTGQSTP